MGYMSISETIGLFGRLQTPVQDCEHLHVSEKRNLDVIGCGDSEVLVRGRV